MQNKQLLVVDSVLAINKQPGSIDVLRVPATVLGKHVNVALDSGASINMLSAAVSQGVEQCKGRELVGCMRDTPTVSIAGVGGARLASTKAIRANVELANGATLESDFQIVPAEAIPLPATGALVSFTSMRDLGVSVKGSEVSVGGKPIQETVAAATADTERCCTPCAAHESLRCGTGGVVAAVTPNFPQAGSVEHYVDILETVGEQLFVPMSAEWRAEVQGAAAQLVHARSHADRDPIMRAMVTRASGLAAPPEKESRIVAQARPCVSAQLEVKLGAEALDSAMEHQRPRPADVCELKDGDTIGDSARVAVAFDGKSALRFDEALANSRAPLRSIDLFGAPAVMDQQKELDFDAFCLPPLEEDPQFEAKWWQRAVVDTCANLKMSKRAKERWIALVSQDYVKGIFKYDLSNIRLAALQGVTPVHIGLRKDAQDRFAPMRNYSAPDCEFAKPMEDGLIKAGLLEPLVLQPGETLRYISQPLVPKAIQEDGSVKRRYAVDFKPTVNVDMLVPKATQWDVRDWHFADHDVLLRTVLDGKMWYFQFLLDRESQLLTAQNMISRDGVWISRGLQLGLAVAPAECIKRNAVMFHELGRDEFRSAMDELIAMSRGTAMSDDVVWHHIGLLERLFKILHRHGAKCSLEKAQFLQSTVRLMGVEHGPGEIRIPKAKVDAIREWPFPTGRQARKQLQSIIAAWQWLATQGFATDFAGKMATCRKIANSKGSWQANELEECKPAFEAMKEELAASIAVQMFDHTKRAVVSGDWSRTSMGGTLSQIQDDRVERPVAVASRGCSPTESKLISAEGEIAVMAWLLDAKWGRFLVHDWFWYVTDQQSLTELVEYLGKEEPRRFYIFNQIRALARLSFYVVARPGKFMPLTDALSRIRWQAQTRAGGGQSAASQAELTNPVWTGGSTPVAMTVTCLDGLFRDYQQRPDVMYKTIAHSAAAAIPVHSHGLQRTFAEDDRLWIVASTAFDVDELIRNCPEIKAIRAMMAGASLKSLDVAHLSTEFVLALNGYRGKDKEFKRFYEHEGRLCHRSEDTGDGIVYERLYIPTSNQQTQLRSRLMFEAHWGSAHRKAGIVDAMLRRNYTWMTRRADVEAWINGCPCKLGFDNGRRKLGALGNVPMGEGPYDQVNIDYFGPLTRGRFKGMTGILSISYPVTGRVIPIGVRSKDAAVIALKFVDTVMVKAPRPPRVCTSDNGSEFVNEVMDNVQKILAIRHVTVAVENPKANTMVERGNRWLKSALQMLLWGLDASFWDHKSIRQALVHLGGIMPSRMRKFTPVFLETGVDAMSGLDLLLSDFAPKPQEKTLADRFAMLRRARELAVFCQSEAAAESRKLHDGKAAPNELQVGDDVWIRIPDRLRHSKLEPEYMGPYRLVEWVQKERRSAWVQNCDDSSDEIRVPVDHMLLAREVPERLRLNFKPFVLDVDRGPMSNSIAQVVETELAELDPSFEGDVGEGSSYDPHAGEPGFAWRGGKSAKSDKATRERLAREESEARKIRRGKQLEEANRVRAAKLASRNLAFKRLTGVEPVEQQQKVRISDDDLGQASPSHEMQVSPRQAAGAHSVEEEEEFEIEGIIEHQTVDLGDRFEREYCVRFKGWSHEHDQWYLESDLVESAPEVIADYEDLLAKRPKLCVDLAVSGAHRRKTRKGQGKS